MQESTDSHWRELKLRVRSTATLGMDSPTGQEDLVGLDVYHKTRH